MSPAPLSTPVRLAFLGCGFITAVHSRHLKSLQDQVVRGYASRDAARADAYCRRFGGAFRHDSYDAAINDPQVDAVVIAVPPRFHLDLTLQALRAGKHVLVEKPAFLRMEDYLAVREARDRADRVVLVGENDHYKPLAIALRRLIASDVIGEMVFAQFMTVAHRLKTKDDWRNDETMAGGDAFFEEGIHWLHLAGSLGPAIVDVQGFRPSVSRTGPDRRAKSMMVAFRYDNDAVGTLYYSREIPSLFKGVRLSKLFGREGIITFESNGLFIIVRGRNGMRVVLPGYRDIRGYKAMYRDFAGAIRERRAPEMSLERAIEDQRLMDRIYQNIDAPTPGVGRTPVGFVWRACQGPPHWDFAVTTGREQFDIIIIGSGAGGGTIAAALAPTGRRILVLERGESLPRHADNWDPGVVWVEQRYRTRERWLNGDSSTFQPNAHYCVGGNTKFWGSVLYRLRREDFDETRHADGHSPAWPISYDDLAPYYERAEAMYHVHGQAGLDPTDPPRPPFPYPPIPHTRGMARILERLRAKGLHPSYLPLGLIRPGEEGGCALCGKCNSFPCMISAKSDAETCGIASARRWPNVELRERTLATRLVTNPSGTRVVAVDVVTNGTPERLHAGLVIVACGAVNSAALLLRSGDGNGLANSSELVGRRYMAHVTTMFSAYKWEEVGAGPHEFHKTIAVNDYYRASGSTPYPLGHIQSQGTIYPEMVQGGAPTLLKLGLKAVLSVFPGSLKAWTDHSIQWLAMTEDLPLPDNRVTLQGDQIRLDYRPSNMKAHRELKRVVRRLLKDLGFNWIFPVSFGLGNTTHQCGTLVFGADPRTSVLDPFCRTHDVENLFVVDASFFPSSAAVNPALTIAAQALRVADHIAETELGSGLRATDSGQNVATPHAVPSR